MSSYLLITCILSALAATGHSLTCIECMVPRNELCTGPSQRCPDGNYSCILSYVVTIVGGMEISNIYIRQCGKSNLCSNVGSMSLPNGRIKSSTNCCNTDDCTPPTPVLPQDSSGKNGVKCKACYAANSKTCNAEVYMDCIGNETMCITKVTSTTGSVPSTTATRGCSTKEMCEPAHQVWNLGKIIVNVDNKCANSGVYLQHSLFLLIISVCLLLNSRTGNF